LKILFLDIETFPNIGYVWGKYEQDVIRYVQESCIATYAAKWLDEPVFGKSLADYPGYKPNSYDDTRLVKEIWKLLDQADVAVAHNGDDFDFRVIRGRFIYHDLTPPSPYRTVDTKKVAKKVGRFNSNRLDDLGAYFGEGRKIKTDFDLWEGCIEGNLESWARMLKYNKQDVVLLEKVYKRLLPYTTNHPNVAEEAAACPKCGSQHIQWRGEARTTTRVYKRFQCKECGGWGRAAKAEKGSSGLVNIS